MARAFAPSPQPKQGCRCGGVAGAGQGRAGGGASTLVLVSTNLSTLTHTWLSPLLAPSFCLCVKSKGKVLTGCNDCISTHDDIIYPKVVFFSELCPGRGLSRDHLSSVQIDIFFTSYCSRYRVSNNIGPTLLFANLSAFTVPKLGEFWKIQEICYITGTRILKIDLEIAEIYRDIQ